MRAFWLGVVLLMLCGLIPALALFLAFIAEVAGGLAFGGVTAVLEQGPLVAAIAVGTVVFKLHRRVT